MSVFRIVKKVFNQMFIALVGAMVLLNACASTITIQQDLSGFPLASYNSEDINGAFPEAIYIKTKTQTFNTYHYYLVRDGFIWYKSIDPEKAPKNWVLFDRTGVPHNAWDFDFSKTSAVMEISADADELVALSAEGGFYRYSFDKSIAYKTKVWLDKQGWPKGSQLLLDAHTARNRTWALGKRNMQVLYYEDPFGNQHHNGTMDIATTYILLEDGQEIAFADNGLPSDFSRNFTGPERGAFKAVSLSASASTMFVINDAGEMYTRIADFDIVGRDPMLFKYTYIPYKSDVPGNNYLSNLNEWGLPAEDWLAQPRIPLAGKAAITRHITILQNGHGNGARELRVGGFNEAGQSGYWTKAIFADEWQFVTAPLLFAKDALLNSADAIGERGETMDRSMSGYWWNKNKKETEFKYTLSNFNILEGDCNLHISWRDETCVLKLHPIELWTYIKRDYLPGRNGPPKMFLVTLDIPENAFKGLSDEFTQALDAEFGGKDNKLFHYTIMASTHYVIMQENEKPKRNLFLVDETLSDNFLEFQRLWYITNFSELQRYESSELMLDNSVALGRERYGELRQKIALNVTFRDELKARVSALGWNKYDAFTFNSIYLPLHYIIRFTPLNFINVPKFNTITRYGKEIVLTNSTYIDTVSNIRIWLFEKTIALLDIRIQCYTDIAKQLEHGAESVAFPAWYSEYPHAYWNIARLPTSISGTLFTLSSKEAPVVLTFSPLQEGYFCWSLLVNDPAGNATPFSIFIDPIQSVKDLYERKGKTPEAKTMRIKCSIYFNTDSSRADSVNPDIEAKLLSIAALFDKEVNAVITFDGKTFEIRRESAPPDHTLIFHGTVH
ncbi:MAG: hypothetical protein LBJ41_06505 [Treponema sp.]|jgi:hypothetical protein|nr:hypothetical protein [Treponema sp.]